MAITFLPYFNSKGVSQIPNDGFLSSHVYVEMPSGMPDYVLPAFDIRNWADNVAVNDSIILVDIGNYTYIDVYKFNSSYIAINIHYQNNIIGRDELNYTLYDYIYLGFGADYDNDIGYISTIFYSSERLHGNSFLWQTYGTEFFEIISTIQPTPPVHYHWHSVGNISGKLGTFNLSTIKNTDINNGDPVSDATSSAFNGLQQTTKLSVLAENKSELTPVIYTDDINYLSLKDLTNNKCELKFYLHNRSFLKITNVSTNAFLSILIDEENKVAKPSIIYKDGSSYSYNQEEPSADTMKHLYEWLMVNEQNIKKKTGLWKTSFAFERLDD